jgi:PTH1 family peptidyl-tRNA hydrolase
VRVGVGRPPSGWKATGYLLGRMGKESQERLEDAVDRAVRSIETLLSSGIEEAMNRYNPSPPEMSEEENK